MRCLTACTLLVLAIKYLTTGVICGVWGLGQVWDLGGGGGAAGVCVGGEKPP